MKLRAAYLVAAVLLAGTVAACDGPGPRHRTVGVVYVADTYDPFWYWFDHHYYYYWHPDIHRVYWSFAFNDYWSSLDRQERHRARARFRRWLHKNRPGLRSRLSDDAFVEREMKTHVLRRAEAAWERKSLKEKQMLRNRLDRARLDGKLPGRLGPAARAQQRQRDPATAVPKAPLKAGSLEQQRRLEAERLNQQRARVIPTPRPERKIRRVTPPVEPKTHRPYSVPFEERRRP